jgi:DNA-binding beta-propeller fold protein YncE
MNLATGATTLLGPFGEGSTNPNGLAYNHDNDTMYMVDNSADNLYTIDLTTGAATLVGSTGTGNLLGLVYVPIPAPSALALLGVAGLIGRGRRRNG